MSVHKDTKSRSLAQQKGLLAVATATATDIGVVGKYDSGTKFAGLVRNTDGWRLFDGLTADPFAGDAVPATGTSNTALAALALSEVKTASITSATTNGNISIAANGSGTLTLTAALVAAAPTVNLGVANKQYVDNAVSGFVAKQSVRVKTTTALTATGAGAGVGKTLTADAVGAIGDIAASFDGVTLIVGNRVLVGSQVAGADNGIYTVTDAGGVAAPWILTRATDADETPEGELKNGAHVFIDQGTVNQNTGWVLQGPFTTFVIDTSTQVWVQFSKETMLSAISNGGGQDVYKTTTNNVLQFRTLAAATASNASLFSVATSGDLITYNVDQTKITATGALASGSIATGFGVINTSNTITGTTITGSSLVSTGTIGGTTITGTSLVSTGTIGGTTITGTSLVSTGPASVETTLSFTGDTTGTNKIIIPATYPVALNFTDGTTDYFNISTNENKYVQFTSDLTVIGGMRVKVGDTITSASYTILATDSILNADSTSNAVTLTLPSAATNAGRTYKIARINTGANTVTVTPGAGTLDGDSTAVVLNAQWDHVSITSHGSAGWFIH